jgi:mono/diheme cytochrome c family protein
VLRRAITAFVVLVSVSACANVATTRDGAEVASAGDPRAGAELYATNCAQCHGAELRGTDLGPPFLDDVYEPSHHADGAFQLAVQRGVQPHHWDFGPMPLIQGLSPADVEDIIAYVRQEQRAVGIE